MQIMADICELEELDVNSFKKDMREAFQLAFEQVYGKTDEEILTGEYIDKALSNDKAFAVKAVCDGELVGGAVVFIEGSEGYLDLLYVKNGYQGKGIGKSIWFYIEKAYPNVSLWKTATPYFDKRNLHFYINVCGFKATEFMNPKHPSEKYPNDPNTMDESDYFFRFEKCC